MSNATYNLTRFTRQVLKRHRRAPPSLVIHLYPTHFRFDGQVRLLSLRFGRVQADQRRSIARKLQLRLADEVFPRSGERTEAPDGFTSRSRRCWGRLLRRYVPSFTFLTPH
jgi:hypothetical protein